MSAHDAYLSTASLTIHAENNTHKNPERVAAGYKGTLNNPNAGQEAKENASQRLREHGEDQRRASFGQSTSGLGKFLLARSPLNG